MASHVVSITYKVNKFLYSRHTAMTFRECGNCLVERQILSDEEIEHHHDEIRSLHLAWKAGFEAQSGGSHQPQPMGPATPESHAPHAAPSNIPSSSPPEGARDATGLDALKEAVENIDPQWPLKGAAMTSLLVPGDPNYRSVAVNRKETLCAQSYIRALTLEKHGIRWNGHTTNLQWQSPPIIPGRDECVQNTCFVVVGEPLAKEAGFSFDMLVGADHGHPLLEQIQALGAEETSSAASSTTDQTEDLSAHSFEDPRSAELHPIPDVYHSSPREVRLVISGPSDGVADFIQRLGASASGISKAMQNPAGPLIGLHNSGSGNRKLSCSDDSGGPSRKNRPAGR